MIFQKVVSTDFLIETSRKMRKINCNSPAWDPYTKLMCRVTNKMIMSLVSG